MRTLFFLCCIVFGASFVEGQATVTFQVDMQSAANFNPSTHTVYISGSTADFSQGIGTNPVWPMPGSVAAYQMSDADGDKVYTLTINNVSLGDYVYKYFMVANNTPTWDLSEWSGNPNRTMTVDQSTEVLQNLWGSLVDVPNGKLVINEMMSNNGLHMDDEGDYEDWIELYNGSMQAVSLQGYSLTDDKAIKNKWVFPNFLLTSGEFLVIWASGKDRTTGTFHTNFSINEGKESVYMYAPDGSLVDSIPIVEGRRDVSYGRLPNGGESWKFLSTTTPETPNTGTGYSQLLSDVTASHQDGYYTSPFNVTFTSPDAGVTIRYTLDGSTPTVNAPILPSSLQVKSRVGDANIFSIIPTNNDPNPGPPYYEGWQPPIGEVYKINVIKARAFHPDAPPGPVNTLTYIVDNKGNNRFTLPVFSLTTDRANFFDAETGIYVAGNHENFKKDWERPAHLSFFESNGNLGFKDQVGVQINGNTTSSRPRKSLRIMYQDHLGNNWLNYPLFTDKTTDKFKQFILRNSGNDWDFTIFRDGFFQSLAKGMSIETQYYRPSILFVNGEYWGIHNIRDKYNDHYLSTKYNVGKNEICIGENEGIFRWGNENGMAHHSNMINYIQTNGVQSSTHYQKVKEWMDVESFVDFQIANIFVKNTDWPGNNTLYWRYVRPDFDPNAGVKDGRWRWMVMDMDFGFDIPFLYVPHLNEGPTFNSIAMALATNGPAWPNPAWSTFLFRKMMENTEFKHYFVNRYSDLLNTRYQVSYVQSAIDSFAQRIEPEIVEHTARWRRPESKTTWLSNVQDLKTFAAARTDAQFQHMSTTLNAGNIHELTVQVSSSAEGYVKVNTIDLLPSTMGISTTPYPWSGRYFSNVPIRLEAVAAIGYEFSHWSGASTATTPIISLTLSANSQITAHYKPSTQEQLVHYWHFDTTLPNDVSLTTIPSTFSTTGAASIQYQSALNGYPFTPDHPQYGKASMERRNSPTPLNYQPLANGNQPYNADEMRGIQIKQPFKVDGENQIQLQVPTDTYEAVYLQFAAKNEGAAESLLFDYQTGNGVWTTTGLPNSTMALTNEYTLFTVDLKTITVADNNPNLVVRIRFGGANLTTDDGKRVSFNNFSLHGTPITTAVTNQNLAGLRIFPNPAGQKLYLQHDTGESMKKLQITDTLGNSKTVILQDNYLDISDLKPGVYFLQITTASNKNEVRKFVKS